MSKLMSQLGIFRDHSGVLKVKYKLQRWKDNANICPILLPKNSMLPEIIILEVHCKLGH